MRRGSIADHYGIEQLVVEQLIKTLPAILRAGGKSEEVVEAAVIAAWKFVAGEALSKHAVAAKLNGKTLVVAVSDAIWQRQLEAMNRPLVLRLNVILGQPLVKRLDFHINAASAGCRVENVSNRSCQTDVDANEVSLEVWSAANAIRDKRLRKTFLAAAASRLRQNESNV